VKEGLGGEGGGLLIQFLVSQWVGLVLANSY